MNDTGLTRRLARALLGVAAACALLLGTPARGALTIDGGSGCPTWNWNAQTQTLTCSSGGPPPACLSISGATSGAVNTPVTLTANCSGATSWTWTGGNCTGVTTQSCAAVSATTGDAFYMVSAVSGGTSGAPAGYTVTWGAGPAFACSFNPTPGTATVGTALPVNVSCSNGTAASFAWSVSPPAGCSANCTATLGSGASTTTGSNTLTLPSVGIWTVTVTAQQQGGGSAQALASVQASTQVGGGTNLCADKGFSKTIFYNWDWAAAPISKLDTWTMADTTGGTGLGTNGILVVAFTPNGPADTDNTATLAATEYPGTSTISPMTLAISTSPCELNVAAPGTSTATSPAVQYGVGTVTIPWTGIPSAVALTPGVQYYINVARRDNVAAATPYGAQTCAAPQSGVCDIRLQVQKPPNH